MSISDTVCERRTSGHWRFSEQHAASPICCHCEGTLSFTITSWRYIIIQYVMFHLCRSIEHIWTCQIRCFLIWSLIVLDSRRSINVTRWVSGVRYRCYEIVVNAFIIMFWWNQVLLVSMETRQNYYWKCVASAVSVTTIWLKLAISREIVKCYVSLLSGSDRYSVHGICSILYLQWFKNLLSNNTKHSF